MSAAFAFETAKIVGTPFGHCWSQIHTFTPEDIEKKEKRGSLLAVLVIKGAPLGIGAVSLGREILGRLHEEYYGSTQSPVFECLGKAVQKVCDEYGGTEIIASVLLNNILYLAIKGEGKVLLKRGDKVGVLLFGDDELKTASGFIQNRDIVLIGSGHFFRVAGDSLLKSALETGSPSEIEESLAPNILGKQDMADAACVISLLKKEEEDSSLKNMIANEELPVELPTKKSSRLAFWENKLKNKLLYKPREIRIRRGNVADKKKIYFIIGILILIGLVVGITISYFKNKAAIKQKTISPLAENQQESRENVQPSVLLEVEPIFSGSKIDDICLSNGFLATLDIKNQKIYRYNLKKKTTEVVDLTGQTDKLTCLDKVYLFNTEGILELDPNKTKPSLKIPADAFWQDILEIDFFGGNIYLLDTDNGGVWRYAGKKDGFGQKIAWFEQGIEAKDSLSFAVDGSIWILKRNGISKYVLGKEEKFSISGFDGGFIEPVKIVTSEKEENLYVLDKGRKEILVFGKGGQYKKAYYWDAMLLVSDFTVSEEVGKIYLAGEGKIYEIEIK